SAITLCPSSSTIWTSIILISVSSSTRNIDAGLIRLPPGFPTAGRYKVDSSERFPRRSEKIHDWQSAHWDTLAGGRLRPTRPSVGQITSSNQKSCQVSSAKIFLFRFSEIHDYPLRYPASTGGAYRDRHGRRKWDAVDARRLSAHVAPTKASSRTAKSCGPDSPTLGSSLRVTSSQAMETIEPGTPGRARSSR